MHVMDRCFFFFKCMSKKTIIKIAAAAFIVIVACIWAAVTLKGDSYSDGVMTVKGKTYEINTSSICDAKGFRGSTPLVVTIKNDVIQKVVALPNSETPQYFDQVGKRMTKDFSGKHISDIESVDGISGATFSSKAVMKNVQAACEYYEGHK